MATGTDRHGLDRTPPLRPKAGKHRHPAIVWALSLLTLGIYAVIHHFAINRELEAFGVDASPGKAAVAMFPGVVLIVPFVVTMYRTGERIAVAQEAEELEPSATGYVSVLAAAVLLLSGPYHQSQLNRVWDVVWQPSSPVPLEHRSPGGDHP